MTKPVHKLHVVPEEPTELDRQLAEQGRTDFVRKQLTAPNFPDHSKREVKYGTLGDWLLKLSGK